jgi:hypothetical protein
MMKLFALRKDLMVRALRPTVLAVASLVVLVSVADAQGQSAVRIPLKALNDSGEIGAAVLESTGDSTRIAITLQNEPADARQPANIHSGDCGAVAAIRYPLHDVRGGRSTTVIDVPLQQLVDTGYVINVQSSAASLRAPKDYRYVSCGEIRRR